MPKDFMPSDNSSQHAKTDFAVKPVQARTSAAGVVTPAADFEVIGSTTLDQLRLAAPDENPKTRYGRAKPGLSSTPATALMYLGRVFDNGAKKYGPHNWRQDAVSSTTYYDAALRHLMLYHDGQLVDEESGLPHLAHVMACCAILIDARAQGKLNDNRPIPGKLAEVIKSLTLPLL